MALEAGLGEFGIVETRDYHAAGAEQKSEWFRRVARVSPGQMSATFKASSIGFWSPLSCAPGRIQDEFAVEFGISDTEVDPTELKAG